MKVHIGPFFCGTYMSSPGKVVSGLNVAVEWSSANKAVSIPLYRGPSEGAAALRLHQIVVRADQIPFDVQVRSPHVAQTPDGMFVPLETLLVELYQKHSVSRRIREVLHELAGLVSFPAPTREAIPASGLLLPKMEQEGLRITNALREGSEVLLEISWHPPGTTGSFHVANCRFELQGCQILENGWVQTQGAPGVSDLLAAEFRHLFPATPLNTLTPAGKKLITSLPSI